jgi:hypothetical protein
MSTEMYLKGDKPDKPDNENKDFLNKKKNSKGRQ